jgi:hypothetical protein
MKQKNPGFWEEKDTGIYAQNAVVAIACATSAAGVQMGRMRDTLTRGAQCSAPVIRVAAEAASNVIGLRPAAMPACDVDVPGIAKIKQARTPNAGILAGFKPRHVRIGSAGDDDGWKRKASARHLAEFDTSRMSLLCRFDIGRGNEQSAIDMGCGRAFCKMGNQDGTKAVADQYCTWIGDEVRFKFVKPDPKDRMCPTFLLDQKGILILIQPMALPMVGV